MRTQEAFSLMKSAQEIAVAIETDGDRIGGVLNEQSPLPGVEGEPVFDYRRHMQSLLLQLESAKDRMVETEDEHAARLIRVARRKSERDEVALGVWCLLKARVILQPQGRAWFPAALTAPWSK